MKKLAFISALVLAVGSFSACSDDFNQKVKEKAVENMEDATADFAMGEVTNGVYSSDFSKMTFTAPDGWTFSSQDEILQMMDVGLDISGEVSEVNGGDAELNKKILEKTTIYDMVAMNELTGENVIIMYENIPAYGLDPKEYTVDDYMENAVKMLNSVDSIQYTQSGEKETVTLGDREFVKTTFEASMPELNYTTSQTYYVSQIDDFMMSIVSSAGIAGTDMSTYESCFGTVK